MFGAEDRHALGKREKRIKFRSETPKERNEMWRLSVDGRKTLTWILIEKEGEPG